MKHFGTATKAPRRLVLLGATGSIGRSCAQVLADTPGRFVVEAVAGGRDGAALARTAIAVGREVRGHRRSRRLCGSEGGPLGPRHRNRRRRRGDGGGGAAPCGPRRLRHRRRGRAAADLRGDRGGPGRRAGEQGDAGLRRGDGDEGGGPARRAAAAARFRAQCDLSGARRARYLRSRPDDDHRLRRAVSAMERRAHRRGDARRGARASQMVDGPEDFDRFGDA